MSHVHVNFVIANKLFTEQSPSYSVRNNHVTETISRSCRVCVENLINHIAIENLLKP